MNIKISILVHIWKVLSAVAALENGTPYRRVAYPDPAFLNWKKLMSFSEKKHEKFSTRTISEKVYVDFFSNASWKTWERMEWRLWSATLVRTPRNHRCEEYLFRHNHYFGDYFRDRRPFSHPGCAAVSRLLSGPLLRPLPRPRRPTMQENVRRHQRLCLSARVGLIPLY